MNYELAGPLPPQWSSFTSLTLLWAQSRFTKPKAHAPDDLAFASSALHSFFWLFPLGPLVCFFFWIMPQELQQQQVHRDPPAAVELSEFADRSVSSTSSYPKAQHPMTLPFASSALHSFRWSLDLSSPSSILFLEYCRRYFDSNELTWSLPQDWSSLTSMRVLWAKSPTKAHDPIIFLYSSAALQSFWWPLFLSLSRFFP